MEDQEVEYMCQEDLDLEEGMIRDLKMDEMEW